MDPLVNPEEAVAGVVRLFENLTPADVARLPGFYADDAWFKDPFNEVQGIAAVQRVYGHMFDTLQAPRFRVTTTLVQGQEAFLAWEFRFAFRNWRRQQDQVVRGSSHLKLARDGRIACHRDYWDAAEEVYEKLPLLGGLMRWLKARAAVG
jgi:ketosteroid isomerase-like protein